MKFYLSSYKLGNKEHILQQLLSPNKKIGYIPNALDSRKNDSVWKSQHIASDMKKISELGINVELLDLKIYFGKKDLLRKKIDSLSGVWISGGNVFILRQAMKLSGFDKILKEISTRTDFVYGGYSAAGCVLSLDLKVYKIVDDATEKPYSQLKRVIWTGLGLIPYAFLPHYKSNHPESIDVDKEVEYCKKNKIPFSTLKDGEVIIIE